MISDQQGDIKNYGSRSPRHTCLHQVFRFSPVGTRCRSTEGRPAVWVIPLVPTLCALSAIDLVERVDGQTGAAETADAANLPRLILEENASKNLESEEVHVVRHPASLLSEEQNTICSCSVT